MAEASKAFVYRNGSRYAIALIGPRGGVQFVEMRSRQLTVCRTSFKDLTKHWVVSEHDTRDAALTFLRHHAGLTETCRKLLTDIQRGRYDT